MQYRNNMGFNPHFENIDIELAKAMHAEPCELEWRRPAAIACCIVGSTTVSALEYAKAAAALRSTGASVVSMSRAAEMSSFEIRNFNADLGEILPSVKPRRGTNRRPKTKKRKK